MKISTEGPFWKVAQLLIHIVYLFTTAVLWRTYDTLNQHQQRITIIEEWKKSYQESSVSVIERLSAVEKSDAVKAIELAVLKEKLGKMVEDTSRAASGISLLHDQFSRLQQATADISAKIAVVQFQVQPQKESK